MFLPSHMVQHLHLRLPSCVQIDVSTHAPLLSLKTQALVNTDSDEQTRLLAGIQDE